MISVSTALVPLALVLAVGAWTRPRLCASMLGAPEDIALTPRADRRIEQLAIQVSKTITADSQTYDRLEADINAIRNLVPRLRELGYQPADDGKGVIVKLDLLARVLLRVGLYRQWDCLNEHYRLESIDRLSLPGSVLLSFKGTYDMQKVASIYNRLSGIERAEPNRLVTVGTSRTLCAAKRDGAWRYVFYEEIGARRLHYFSSASQGSVTAVDIWDIPESAEVADATRPSWVAQYWNAEACGQ